MWGNVCYNIILTYTTIRYQRNTVNQICIQISWKYYVTTFILLLFVPWERRTRKPPLSVCHLCAIIYSKITRRSNIGISLGCLNDTNNVKKHYLMTKRGFFVIKKIFIHALKEGNENVFIYFWGLSREITINSALTSVRREKSRFVWILCIVFQNRVLEKP